MPSFQHLLLTTAIFFLGGRCRPNLHNHKSSVVCEARREPNHHPDDPPYHDDDSRNNNNYEHENSAKSATTSSSSHPSKLPEIDPLSDGILLRPLMTYTPQLQSSSSSLEDKWVMFDFRPIFPPYSMEKVNDALVVRQQQQQQQQQQQEEEAEKEKEEEIEEMFEKKEENVSVAKTMSEREDDHDEAINEGRTSISASLSSSSSSSSMAVGEEEEERVTTKTITERNDSNPTDVGAMTDGEEEIEMIHSSATSSSEKPREADHDSERIVDEDERGIQEGIGAVGDDEGDEAITATATATTSITNHSKASTSITDEETDNEEDEKTIENGPEVALIQGDGDDDGDDDDEKNTNTITNVNANATIQSTEDNHHVKSKNIDNDQPLPIVDENTKESTGGTWSSHDDDETKPMAKDVPVVHADDVFHDSEQDDHDENNVDYATKEIEVDEHQQQQQEGHEQQQYEMLDESKTNEGDRDENEKEIAAEPETLPITEGDGNGNLADGMQSSLPEAEHDSLSTDASSDAESWDEDGEFGQTPQEQEGKEPERISLRGERQQKQQQLENDVPVTSSPLEEPLQNDAATREAIGYIDDNSKDYPNTDDSLDRVLSMLDDIKLPDTTIPLPPSSSSSASGESSSTNANREFVTGLDEIDKLFESVSPPDELDVGADGQSIQEVLTTQGIKIIAKRAKGVWRDVRGWFEHSVQGALPQWREGGKHGGGGRGGGGGSGSSIDDDELEDIASLIRNGNGDALLSEEWSLNAGSKHGRNKDASSSNTRSDESLDSNADDTATNGKDESQHKHGRMNKMQETFPLLKTKHANKLWKFAQRKWKQAKHILDDLFSIFDLNDGNDDDGDDDVFDLSELNLDGIQSLISKGGDGGIVRGRRPIPKGEKPPNFDGKFGSAVDESFLKQRYEAMMKLQDSKK